MWGIKWDLHLLTEQRTYKWLMMEKHTVPFVPRAQLKMMNKRPQQTFGFLTSTCWPADWLPDGESPSGTEPLTSWRNGGEAGPPWSLWVLFRRLIRQDSRFGQTGGWGEEDDGERTEKQTDEGNTQTKLCHSDCRPPFKCQAERRSDARQERFPHLFSRSASRFSFWHSAGCQRKSVYLCWAAWEGEPAAVPQIKPQNSSSVFL